MPEITDKEFYILSELEKRAPVSQRELSLKAGLSLGMTNYLLQKMAGIGLIKIRQLNRKKISYLLTEKGFKEKARKSYNYVKKTVNSYRQIEKNIEELLRSEYMKGKRIFCLDKKDEISGIIEAAAKKTALPSLRVEYLDKHPDLDRFSTKDSALVCYLSRDKFLTGKTVFSTVYKYA